MADIYAILPDVLLYISCGFLFLQGYYLIVDQRFAFASETGLMITLIVGFLELNLFDGFNLSNIIKNPYILNAIIVFSSFLIGMIVAVLKNIIIKFAENVAFSLGRKKTSSSNFWFDVLDPKNKPMWIRLMKNDERTILEGVLLSLDEKEDNPYMVLGYFKKYDFNGNELINEYSSLKYAAIVVRPDDYDEIIIMYDHESEKNVSLTVTDSSSS